MRSWAWTDASRTEPRHVETMRAKLKRVVARGILAEPEPGLFTPARPAPGTAAPECTAAGDCES